MSILVTGCAGFIGSHFCEKILEAGNEVVGIDNINPYYNPKIKKQNLEILETYKNFVFVNNDIRDFETLSIVFSNYDIDKIVHIGALAGVRTSIQIPNAYVSANIGGTLNLLELCRLYDIPKFVFASSSSVYGNEEDTPFTESSCAAKPISPYAATKRSCELFGYTYYSMYGINFTALRFFTVYGPRGRPDMAVYKFTKAIFEETDLFVYGSGEATRDFTYVSDIVEGIQLALDKDLGYEIFNLGNGQPISINALIKKLETIIGKKAKVHYLQRKKGDVNYTHANIEKAKTLLGYNPKVPIDKGLTLFVDWFKNSIL